MSKPKVILLTMGGTIATQSGVAPNLPGSRLLQAVPKAEEIAALEARDVLAKPSSALMLDDIALLVRNVEEALQEADGIVITHGTDTLEETAFLLSLLISSPKPIVITGALRRPDLAGADGPANLLASIRVAASPHSQGKGILVVFNDEIHAAAFVQKSHSFLPSAFTSLGPLGWVAENRVRFFLVPASKMPQLAIGNGRPVVPLLELGLVSEPRMIRGLIDQGLDGFVLNTTGVGHVAASSVEDLERFAKTLPIVFASRTGHGETFVAGYTFSGGETDLIRRGLIPSGFLSGRQARLVLILLLSQGADLNAIRSWFQKNAA